MKKIILIFAGFLTYTLLHFIIIYAYENTKAHTKFNEVAVDVIENLVKSSYKEGDELWVDLSNNLNSITGPGVTNPGFFVSTYGEGDLYKTPKEWISHGGYSADEPEVPAATKHFYDPLGLRDGKKYLTNRGTYWEGLYPNPGIDAIEWALGDTPNSSSNNYSAKKGKEYFLLSMKETDLTKKRRYIAMAWRSLGEVLHNTADMLCPAHVRNDSHAAPFGLSWGWAFGSPDPYEEIFNPNWISLYSKSDPDPNLKQKILKAKTIREINEALATFTNANFFSNETISGYGVKQIEPANGEKSYPSPKLESLEYVADEFTFYKTFPSGRRIKMCKDHSYFRFRSYPYIDYDCVQSQASELIPNFIFAAMKIFTLYLPPVYVTVDSLNTTSGKVFGSIKFAEKNKPEEYPDLSSATYNGEVILRIDGNIFKGESKNGIFEANVAKDVLEKSKKIQAYIDLYGVQFYSSIFDNSLPTFKSIQQFILGLKFKEEGSNNEKGFSINFLNKPITSFANNTLTIQTDKKDSYETLNQTITIKFGPRTADGKLTVEKLTITEKYSYFQDLYGYKVGDESNFTFELSDNTKSIELMESSNLMWLTMSSDKLKSSIKTCNLETKEHKLKYDNNSNPIGTDLITKNYTLNNIIWSSPSISLNLILTITK